MIKITEVAEVVGGATPRTNIDEYWDGDILWATPKDLSNLKQKYISDTPRKITESGLKSCAAEIIPSNSVLFSSRAPIGHLAINTKPMATNQGFKSFVPGPKIDARFLYWWLDASRERLQSLGTGSTFKEVTKSTVQGIEIPLPPLQEQKKIAEMLDAAEALITKRACTLNLLDELKQSIFIDMFGDISKNRKNLPIATIDELTDCLDNKRKPVKAADRTPGPIPYYGANGQQGWIDDYIFDEPLVLVAEDGGHFDNPERGVAYSISGKSWVNNHAHILRPKPGKVNITYLESALKHYNFMPFISGTTRAKLTKGSMLKVPLLQPDMKAQNEFELRINQVDNIAKRLSDSEGNLRELFNSLQQKAFTGELTEDV